MSLFSAHSSFFLPSRPISMAMSSSWAVMPDFPARNCLQPGSISSPTHRRPDCFSNLAGSRPIFPTRPPEERPAARRRRTPKSCRSRRRRSRASLRKVHCSRPIVIKSVHLTWLRPGDPVERGCAVHYDGGSGHFAVSVQIPQVQATSAVHGREDGGVNRRPSSKKWRQCTIVMLTRGKCYPMFALPWESSDFVWESKLCDCWVCSHFTETDSSFYPANINESKVSSSHLKIGGETHALESA